jgi:hypothetical protein
MKRHIGRLPWNSVKLGFVAVIARWYQVKWRDAEGGEVRLWQMMVERRDRSVTAKRTPTLSRRGEDLIVDVPAGRTFLGHSVGIDALHFVSRYVTANEIRGSDCMKRRGERRGLVLFGGLFYKIRHRFQPSLKHRIANAIDTCSESTVSRVGGSIQCPHARSAVASSA